MGRGVYANVTVEAYIQTSALVTRGVRVNRDPQQSAELYQGSVIQSSANQQFEELGTAKIVQKYV